MVPMGTLLGVVGATLAALLVLAALAPALLAIALAVGTSTVLAVRTTLGMMRARLFPALTIAAFPIVAGTFFSMPALMALLVMTAANLGGLLAGLVVIRRDRAGGGG